MSYYSQYIQKNFLSFWVVILLTMALVLTLAACAPKQAPPATTAPAQPPATQAAPPVQPSAACVSSNGTTKGTYENGSDFIFHDYCVVGSSFLIQYYCENSAPRNRNYICPNSCLKGACK